MSAGRYVSSPIFSLIYEYRKGNLLKIEYCVPISILRTYLYILYSIRQFQIYNLEQTPRSTA